MKKAIGYVRISDKDQSNFSIEGQTGYILKHAEKHSLELMAIFTDDGKSAKNFDRPNWKALEKFIQDHYPVVNVLIVIKYDRFSRNTAEGLTKIMMLEKKFNIIIMSVFEEMFVDIDSPYFFKQRADMLVNAEFEWHVIRDRTKMGQHTALSAGRFISKAPVGYLNKRDDRNRPILVVDEKMAEVIRFIFNTFLNGWSLGTILKAVGGMDYKQRSHSAIQRVLTNPVYAGLINVPAYRKEAAKVVDGQHEAIIDKDTWHRVQVKFMKPNRQQVQLTEHAPLRGVLECPECFRPMTAAASKGKTKYYWYYKCNTHTNINFNSIKIHDQFVQVLSLISLSEKYIGAMLEMAEIKFSQRMAEVVSKKKILEKQLKEIVAKLESLEEKFIAEQINGETYSKWHARYSQEKSAAEHEYKSIAGDMDEKYELFKSQLPNLAKMPFIYNKATVALKQQLIKTVFDKGLSYRDGIYRTPSMHPFFLSQFNAVAAFGLLELKQKHPDISQGANSASDGNRTPYENQLVINPVRRLSAAWRTNLES